MTGPYRTPKGAWRNAPCPFPLPGKPLASPGRRWHLPTWPMVAISIIASPGPMPVPIFMFRVSRGACRVAQLTAFGLPGRKQMQDTSGQRGAARSRPERLPLSTGPIRPRGCHWHHRWSCAKDKRVNCCSRPQYARSEQGLQSGKCPNYRRPEHDGPIPVERVLVKEFGGRARSGQRVNFGRGTA